MPVPKPPFYRYVPIATHWRTPVVAKERLMPVRGNLPLPTDIQRILFPPRHYPQPLNPFRPRRPPPAVSAWCSNSKMHVRVQKNLYSRQSRHLTLGVGCKSNLESKYYYYFNYGLHECGSNRSVINGQLTYSNILHHTPPKTKGPVHRSLPFNLSIQCRYNRFHQVYKVGYRALLPRNYHFRNLKNKHSFVLSTANADWTRLSSRNAYDLGQPMYFQATAYFVSEEQRLFIHWCYATLSPNHFSEPRFKVIDNFG
ncbi:ZP3 protein, partial [Amia calva]|nr:ZP3 protein [Amia calva]